MERKTSKQATPPIDWPIGSKAPPILLYFHPSMKKLAEQVVETIAHEQPAKKNLDEADVSISFKPRLPRTFSDSLIKCCITGNMIYPAT